MSSKRRGAFDVSATNVTVLPEPPAPKFPARQVPDIPEEAASAAPSAATESRPTQRSGRQTAQPRRPRQHRYPDAAVAPELAQKLRELAIAEKAADPISARSHGTIVLQAIERNAEGLQQHFAPKPTATSGLFAYTDNSVTRQRRRHGQVKPVKIVLAGILKSDAKKLDELVKLWGTGNRSALVEEALRMYFDDRD
ncbi:hypothetical protein [Williamsia sterculiae]|uniref:Ribbon-helix-helix protein, copG family n=1 Tax=Williamsia sterculiae TaxID=1344003 RepID=A0A1N7HF07_9NOCA|nr:hypothetical protein [Williamsia sterculiae]SIS23353.1 hypothetical protein SAMN05445060_4103 [Williamsia sterculiae]